MMLKCPPVLSMATDVGTGGLPWPAMNARLAWLWRLVVSDGDS